MCAVVVLLLLLVWPAAAGDDQKIAYSGRTFGGDPLPIFDKGYLLFLSSDSNLTVYSPGGMRVSDPIVLDPYGRKVGSVDSAAIDTSGTLAVAVAYWTPQIARGGIAFLDASGNQTRFVPMDGLFQPAQVCFDQNHFLWVFGWHRDGERGAPEEPKDPYLVRKLSIDGKEMGRYLLRSQFGSPFYSSRGLWQVCAAKDRIGALAQRVGAHPELIELDLEGRLIGHWPLGKRSNGGYAYTSDGRLFAKRFAKSGVRELVEFDRNTGAWIAVEDVSAKAGEDFQYGLLLGAEGNQLVFADGPGQRLLWAPAAP